MKHHRTLSITAVVAAGFALSGCMGSSSDSSTDMPELGEAEEMLTPQAVTDAYNAVVQDLDKTDVGTFGATIEGDYEGAMVVSINTGGDAVADLAVSVDWDSTDPGAPAFDGAASNFLIYRAGGVTEVEGELTVDQTLANSFDPDENESVFVMTGDLTPAGAAQNEYQATFAGAFYDGTDAHAGQVNMSIITGGGDTPYGTGNFYLLNAD